MRPRTVGALVAGGLLAGGTGMVLSAPGLLSASAPPDDTTVEDSEAEDSEAEDVDPIEVADPIGELVEALVESGALTQEQADSILEQLVVRPRITITVPDLQAFPDRPGRREFPGFPDFPKVPGLPSEIVIGGPFGPQDHHGRGGLFGGAFQRLDVIADTIGIEESDLRDELRSGSTIAEVAEANGVDPQTVIDALVAHAEERITDFVHGGDATDDADDSDTTDTTETTEA